MLSVNSVYPYLLPLGSRKMRCRCRCCRCCFLRSWRNKTIIKLKLNEKKRKENGMEWKWNKPEWNGILMLWYLDVLTPGVYRYLMAWCLMSNVWCRGCQCTHYTHSLTHPLPTCLSPLLLWAFDFHSSILNLQPSVFSLYPLPILVYPAPRFLRTMNAGCWVPDASRSQSQRQDVAYHPLPANHIHTYIHTYSILNHRLIFKHVPHDTIHTYIPRYTWA